MKDLDKVSKLTNGLMAVVKVLSIAMRPLFRLGFLRRITEKSIGGRVGVITRHAKRGEHEKAVALAIDALKEYRHQGKDTWMVSGTEFWWFFVHLAAESLKEYDDQAKREEVIELARNGVEPFQGYYVARAFLTFSSWNYRDGDHDRAIEFAGIAASADDTWAEPNFVLGWYHLVLGSGNPIGHFTQAIQKNHAIFLRIANDPECRKHPHIVQELKNLSADGIVTVQKIRPC